MSESLYFYDLETSGINPREDRIMQFAGQRTDMSLKPVGDPHNILIKMNDDILPDPSAILITGITPQQVNSEGVSEIEFLQIFHSEIATPGTIFTGFNTIRFDDEFMRFLHFRNFYDPYEWQYTDGKSRWDLLDVVRMTRALRPDGIDWPVDDQGKPTNRLELLTKANGLAHDNAHDALSDVMATIAISGLIKQKQPKLFDYLLNLRSKNAVSNLVESDEPFVYCSGKYSNDYEKTTVAVSLAKHPQRQASLVYDLRYDPSQFDSMSPDELVELWRWNPDRELNLPVKTLQYNRCPAIAPLSVLDVSSQARLGMDMENIKLNLERLKKSKLGQKILEATELIDKQKDADYRTKNLPAEARLYDGFICDVDRKSSKDLACLKAEDLAGYTPPFKDHRLRDIYPLYKARNYKKYLSDEERAIWEKHIQDKLLSGGDKSRLANFITTIQGLLARQDVSARDSYLLEELQLYGQSIMPTSDS